MEFGNEEARSPLKLGRSGYAARLRFVTNTAKLMQELPRPTETFEDERSAEMIRVWLANEQLHVSLRLGMWNDAEDCQIDERDAWGYLLSDLTRHIANGMMQRYGWDFDSTRESIRVAFLKNYDNKSGRIEERPS